MPEKTFCGFVDKSVLVEEALLVSLFMKVIENFGGAQVRHSVKMGEGICVNQTIDTFRREHNITRDFVSVPKNVMARTFSIIILVDDVLRLGMFSHEFVDTIGRDDSDR